MIYPHAATAWVKGLEDADGNATWVTLHLSPIRWDEVRGSRRTLTGDASSDSVAVLVPLAAVPDGLPLGQGDRIAFGDLTVSSPPKDAHVVTSVDAIRVSGSVHHWEVEGK